MIPYGKQSVDDEDIKSVVEALKGEVLTKGPLVEAFESLFAKTVDAKYAVAVNSGTAALHLAMLAANIPEGSEVITTPNTFAATANAILYCNCKPVFADIELENYNINPKEIEKKITDKTKAIIPVHFGGLACNMGEINKIAEKYNLKVIEDACHALGAFCVGSENSLTCYSLHPIKHITTGEGGVITTNDYDTYLELKMLRDHGRQSGDQIALGYNYRMSEINAALGISQLKKVFKFIIMRHKVAKLYHNNEIGSSKFNFNNSYHLYVIKVNNRDKVKEHLADKGIETQIHYKPVYLHSYYKNLGYEKGLCPNAEKYYENCLSIPIYPELTTEQQEYIIKSIKEAIEVCK